MTAARKRGNPNPSPATRFKPGQAANPGGKTGLQRELEIQNAELATRIRSRLLKAVFAVVDQATDEAALNQVEADVLRLLKDSEDRGLGAPKASVDLSNADGSLRPSHEAITDYLRSIHGNPDPKP